MQRDLVLRAKAGDHEAFTALAAASIARLHRAARLILRDDDRASDAVQEALVAAWLDIRAVRDPDRFDAWLHRVLVRACYREAGRHRRRGTVEVHVEALEMADGRTAGADLATRDLLDRAFRRLTPDLRAPLVAHHYLGLRDAEAAEMLSIPLGTFKSRLHRATDALRAALEAEERAPGHARESIA
jgi:RNA polymerase sigma-70 factor (ECF subfamily)